MNKGGTEKKVHRELFKTDIWRILPEGICSVSVVVCPSVCVTVRVMVSPSLGVYFISSAWTSTTCTLLCSCTTCEHRQKYSTLKLVIYGHCFGRPPACKATLRSITLSNSLD